MGQAQSVEGREWIREESERDVCTAAKLKVHFPDQLDEEAADTLESFIAENGTTLRIMKFLTPDADSLQFCRKRQQSTCGGLESMSQAGTGWTHWLSAHNKAEITWS